MELTHRFRVPVGVEEAWVVLRDIQLVAPCMPGATIDSVDGDHFTGTVKVKVGPISMQYKGEAEFVDVDDAGHTAAISANGRETKGSGTARARVSASAVQDGAETEVTLVTDLTVTGRPAQFGRGVMADVGGKLVGQFADCLSAQLSESQAPSDAAATPDLAMTSAGGAPAAPAEPAVRAPVPPPSPDAIDLLGVAGAPVLRRAAPVLGAFALGSLLTWLLGRRSARARR